jgi:hypothetical protein
VLLRELLDAKHMLSRPLVPCDACVHRLSSIAVPHDPWHRATGRGKLRLRDGDVLRLQRDEKVCAAIVRVALQRPIKRRAPESVPLGSNGIRRECYWVRVVDDNDQVDLSVGSVTPRGLIGRAPTTGADACVPYRLLRNRHVKVELFFRGRQTRYDCLGDYLLDGWTQFYLVRWAVDSTMQFLFNRRPLVRYDRIDVLRRLVEDAIRFPQRKVSPLSVMASVNDIRVLRHPKRNQHAAYYNMLIESLRDSGDLKQESSGFEYGVAPRALKTISEFELEERRHRDSLRVARRVATLTVVWILVACAQLVVMVVTRQ